MKKLRLSRFANFVELDNNSDAYALYNALNLGVVFVHRDLEPMIRAFRQPASKEEIAKSLQPDSQAPFLSLIEELARREILVSSDHEESRDLVLLTNLLDRQRIRVLYMILTDKCNFACRYCYVEGNIPENYQFSAMAPETAQRALDFYAKYALTGDKEEGREETIIFYGGEPLINFETLRFAIEYVEKLIQQGKLPNSVGLVLNTNASLVNPSIARFLADKKVSVSVSIDGPEEIHNANRIYPSGAGTFADTARGFRLLQEAGARPSISCTITEQNLRNLKETFLWLVETFGIKSMGFNLLLDASASWVSDPDSYSARASAALIECFLLAREMGIHEDRMLRKVDAFVDGRVYPNDCAGCGQQIVAAPDGHVGTCSAFLGTRKYFTNLSAELNPYTHPIWREWRRRSPLTMPQCQDCIALGICGGGCLHNAFLRGGSIQEVDPGFCVHAKTTLNFLLQDLYERTVRGSV